MAVTRFLDIVTPLLRADLDRYRIQLETLQRFWQINGKVHVLVHEHEWSATDRQALSALDERIHVVTQESLLGFSPRVADLSGWYVQQLAKLAAPSFVETPYYLCLDADTCVERPVTWQTLFDDGLAPYCALTADVTSKHQRGSCAVLGVQPEALKYATEWTTKFMHADTVRALQRAVEQRYPAPWYDGLAHAFLVDGHAWCEYGLYHAFLEQTGRLFDVHACMPDSLNGLYFWDKGDHLRAQKNPEGGPFILCGSKAGVSAQFTRRFLAKLPGLEFLERGHG